MKLLSAEIGGVNIFLLGLGYLLYFEGLFIGNGLSRDAVSLFAVFTDIAMLTVGGYLVFKFERRSGIVSYQR